MEMNASHVKGRIALFVHHPRCSIQSVNGIIKSLEEHYVFKTFTKHEIEDGFFDDVDIVCFAGGIGDSDAYDFLFRDNGDSIRRYVQNGGRYLGICMGAYLIAIILTCWTVSLATSILSDLMPAPEDITVKELNVTGTALLIGSSFTMDLHLSETNQLLKPLPGTQTGIQQQLSKDV